MFDLTNSKLIFDFTKYLNRHFFAFASDLKFKMEEISEMEIIIKNLQHDGTLPKVKFMVKLSILEHVKSKIRKHNANKSKDISPTDVSQILQTMDELGLKNHISNIIYNMKEEGKKRDMLLEWKGEDKCPAIELIRSIWVKEIDKKMMLILHHKGIYRDSNKNGLNCSEEDNKGSETHPYSLKPSGALGNEFIFEHEDLLYTICSARSGNISPRFTPKGMISLALQTPSPSHLIDSFPELTPTNMHIGLDDCLKDSSRFILHRQKLGIEAIKSNYAPISRQFLKYGAPASLRPRLWRVALGLQSGITAQEVELFNANLNDLQRRGNPLNAMFSRDLEAIKDDVTYFPFMETLKRVFVCFSRDSWITANSFMANNSISTNDIEGQLSSIHPFRGLVYLVAPLCLVYKKDEEIFFAFRILYSKFWCKLSAISTMPGMIVCLVQHIRKYSNEGGS